MKINYRNSNGRLSAEFDAETQRDLFEQIARFQEVFDEGVCGKCGSEHLKYVVRAVDENQYYEIRCLDCGAVLQFGLHKKGGGLFPKRKDKEGGWLPDKGWMKWDSKAKKLI